MYDAFMKAIVDGKAYDTDTATLVSTSKSALMGNPLYITNNQNWFQAFFVNRGGQDKVIPISAEEAKNLLHSRNDVEALKKYFPDSIEDA